MKKDTIQPEMQDIMNAVRRYVVANKKNVCFVGNFMAIDSGKLKRNEKDIVNDDGSRLFAYGMKGELKILIDELKEMIASEADEDGFVNV